MKRLSLCYIHITHLFHLSPIEQSYYNISITMYRKPLFLHAEQKRKDK
ncbi:hypothetical protein BACCOP_01813 [Phocaeicola coprocola DSM 17136]|uniref:Uncharacterized protein n=1 Tax=Phocaeicola coprocola DSM 17136 TaxID=470145 RepID=B3JIV1_9BACT|nr:hypothetical protein BACCOP_01813 [Phocaeicola coprocola DSM 17136]